MMHLEPGVGAESSDLPLQRTGWLAGVEGLQSPVICLPEFGLVRGPEAP